MRSLLVFLFIISSLALCAQDSTAIDCKLKKHFYRSEIISGSLVTAGGILCLSYAVQSQNNVTSSIGIGGITGLVIGSIVLGLGIDDLKDFKKQKLQIAATGNTIGLVFTF